MKKIIYELLQGIDSDGNPVLSSVELGYSEANLSLAKNEAYKGEYTIKDDGMEKTKIPFQLDIIEAQVTYTAMMTNTLLEGGND